jgi:isochorismate hydrolase
MAASGNLESYVMGAIEDIIKKAIQDATYPVPQTALATNYSKALMEEYYGEDLKTFYSSKFLNRVVPGLEDAGSIGWKRDLLPAHSSHWKCSNCGAPDEDGEKCSYCQCSRVIQSEG